MLLRWRPEVGVGDKLGGDVKPSRDQELQSNTAFCVVVTPVWVPALTAPSHQACFRPEASRSGPWDEAWRWGTCGKNQKEKETARIGPEK